MKPIDTTRNPTDLAANDLASTHDPLAAVEPQVQGSADNPRASIECWNFCGDGAIGTGIKTNVSIEDL